MMESDLLMDYKILNNLTILDPANYFRFPPNIRANRSNLKLYKPIGGGAYTPFGQWRITLKKWYANNANLRTTFEGSFIAYAAK